MSLATETYTFGSSMQVQYGTAITNQFLSGKLTFADSAFLYGLSGTAAGFSLKLVEKSTEHIRKGKLKLQESFQHQAELKDRWEAAFAEETFTSWKGTFGETSAEPSKLPTEFQYFRTLANAAMLGAYGAVVGRTAAAGEKEPIEDVAVDAGAEIGLAGIQLKTDPAVPDLQEGCAHVMTATTEVTAENMWTLRAGSEHRVTATAEIACAVGANKLELTPEMVEVQAGLYSLSCGDSRMTVNEAGCQTNCGALSLLAPEIVFE